MPCWDGGRDNRGKAHKPVWPKIAAMAAGEIRLATLMEAAFHEPKGFRPPLPNMIPAATGLAAYRHYRQHGEKWARDRLDGYRKEFSLAAGRASRLQGIPPGAAAKQVLRDPSAGLSPLFRHCTAIAGGALPLALEYEALAADELARSWFALSAGWGDYIPNELRRKAATIVSALGAEVEVATIDD